MKKGTMQCTSVYISCYCYHPLFLFFSINRIDNVHFHCIQTNMKYRILMAVINYFQEKLNLYLTFFQFMNYITGDHMMLFQLLLFFKKLVKAPTRAFIVFNCCSCTRLKLAINELISLRCSSIPQNAALNISFSSSFFTSSLALFLLIFLWVLFTFLLSSPSAISSSLFASTTAPTPELEPA